MISYFLEKRRQKKKSTIIGVEFDTKSISLVKVIKSFSGYSLDSYHTEVFTEDAFVDNDINPVFLSKIIKSFIVKNKLSKKAKLGFMAYTDIDFYKESYKCDKKSIMFISESGLSEFIREFFLKKKFPNNYKKIPFTYVNNIKEDNSFEIYFMQNSKYIDKIQSIGKYANKDVVSCEPDTYSVIRFVESIFNNENKSVLLGLYADKICFYSFSKEGKLEKHEVIKLFDHSNSAANYIDEVLLDLDRFVEMMSLDSMSSLGEDVNPPTIYLYGLKLDFDDIAQNIIKLYGDNCIIIDPFENIDTKSCDDNINEKYKYLGSLSLALREEL